MSMTHIPASVEAYVRHRAWMMWSGQYAMQLYRRLVWLLEYEPSWFCEIGSGFGMMWWSAFVFFTDDFDVHGTALITPMIGLVFSPFRIGLAVPKWWWVRSILAACSATFFVTIICSSYQRFGVSPALGIYGAVVLMDVLTLMRFSIPCIQALSKDLRGRRAK